MEFYKKELMEALYDVNKTEKEKQEARQIWDNSCNLYAAEMQKIKNLLPKNFYKELQNGFFHDASVESLLFIKNRRVKQKETYDIILNLDDNGKKSQITHHEILCFKSNVEFPFSKGYIDFGDYIFGEIMLHDRIWTHNILLFNYCEINIKCKKITWKETTL